MVRATLSRSRVADCQAAHDRTAMLITDVWMVKNAKCWLGVNTPAATWSAICHTSATAMAAATVMLSVAGSHLQNTRFTVGKGCSARTLC
jgi:hypothetical protein